MVGINPYQEKIAIEVVTEGFGKLQKETGSLARAGEEANFALLKSGKQVADQMDKRSQQSFQTLEDDLKSVQEVANKGRTDALNSLQQTAKVKPPEAIKGDYFEMPDIAKEHGQQLDAMEANMADFRTKMGERGIDVGKGATMGEDVSETMGGEAPDRKAGLAVTQDLIRNQEVIKKGLQDELGLRKQNLGYLEEQKEKAQAKLTVKAAEKKALEHELKLNKKIYEEGGDKRLRGQKEQKKVVEAIEADLRKNERTTRHITRQTDRWIKKTEEEQTLINDINDDIAFTKKRVDDLKNSKDAQLNTDKNLAAVEGKRRKEEGEALTKYKKREKENNRIRKRTNDLLRTRRELAKSFNRQIEVMATSFKTTLVGALAVSTAATTAFFMKLDSVRQVFMEFEKELMNAQSIFQTNQETLYGLSDQIVTFGNNYGVSMQNASQGLYTLASAGLSAEESMEVLGNTLKLSMAVQGDHETIAKLTTQTIFGFGLEMSDSAELTDKFAHSINKSLIEYQDLASAVKFAMPFFVSTGQSVDQLLGSLEILTNRALEAGIAGRGLRQALAEFAQHAEDNTAAFAKMGIEIVNADGTFKQLTEIAKDFSDVMGPAANDVELMTLLLEDLNVRGATAFVHLVQNADEFQEAVDDLGNASGSATEMADIQQQSLAMSIETIKNALQTPFLLSDEIGKQQGYMNEFSMVLHQITQQFEGMFVVMEDGIVTGLTPMGEMIKEFVIVALQEFYKLTVVIVDMMMMWSEQGTSMAGLLKMMTVPLQMIVKLLGVFGPELLEAAILFKLINGLLPINNILMMMRLDLLDQDTLATMQSVFADGLKMGSMQGLFESYSKLALSQAGISIGLFAMIYMTRKFAGANGEMVDVIGAVAGAFFGLAFAIQIYNAGILSAMSGPAAFVVYAALMIATIAAFIGLNRVMSDMMKAPDMPEIDYQGMGADNSSAPKADTGYYPLMDSGSGGLGSRHQSVMVEPGEVIISKTQNMLGGGATGQGVTIQISGDVYDGDNFAEKIAEILPEAMRRQNDMGGIQ